MPPRPAPVRRTGRTLFPFLALTALMCSGMGCGTPRPTAADTPVATTPAAALPAAATGAGEWTDITDPRYWRSYGGDTFPEGWTLEDGALVRTGAGGDIVTREEYGSFELELDWKVAACGNSGIFYRGAAGADYIWLTAPEYQVLDDTCHDDAQYPSHRAGGVYDLYTPPDGVARPGGEWNSTRIVARGAHVEHWLNGVMVGEYEQGSPAWIARVAASKFREYETFGTHTTGLIGLQDHGDMVWYRHIRIRRLD